MIFWLDTVGPPFYEQTVAVHHLALEPFLFVSLEEQLPVPQARAEMASAFEARSRLAHQAIASAPLAAVVVRSEHIERCQPHGLGILEERFLVFHATLYGLERRKL